MQADRADARSGGAWRRALRALCVLCLLLAAAAAALIAFRRPLTAWGIEEAAARSGLEGLAVAVDDVGLNGAELSVVLPGGVEGRVVVTYDAGTLVRERRVRDVRIEDAAFTLRADQDGVRVVGLEDLAATDDGASGARPFETLTVDDARVTLLTPAGRAEGQIDAVIAGEAVEVRARLAGEGGVPGAALRGGTVSAELSLDGSGGLNFAAEVAGTLEAMDRRADDVSLRAALSTDAWRQAAGIDGLSAEGEIVLSSASTMIGAAGLRVSGASPLELSGGVLRARPVFSLVRDDGASVAVEDGTTLDWSFDDAVGEADGRLSFDLPQAKGSSAFEARFGGGEAPSARLDAAFDAVVAGASVSEARFAGSVSFGNGSLDFSGDAGGTLNSWPLGPVTLRAPGVAGSVEGQVQVPGGSLVVAAPSCLRAPSATAEIGEASVRLGKVRLCADGPLAEIAGTEVTAAATVTAETAATRIADTPLTGRGLTLPFAATVQGVSGRLTLDVLPLPGDLAATGTVVSARTSDDGLLFEVMKSRIAQTIDAPAVAAMTLSGRGIASEATRFDGTLSLGETVIADVALRQGAAAGEAVATSRRLVFAPDGLTPARVLPVLRGVVSEATGAASGTARASWGEDQPLETAAELTLDELSFRGPGLTVQRTAGLSGTLNLSSLFPLASAGIQDLSVRLIDLGAIQLPDGEALLLLPGDGTLEVVSAVFPWMGGRLSVKEATLAMGGNADAVLRIEDVSLAQLLAVLDVNGLSAEGTIDGTLPLAASSFAIAIENGQFATEGPGVIRYTGQVSAAARAGQGATLAFSALEELRFERLTGRVDGPLDGTLDFGLRLEGTSRVDLGDPRVTDRVTAPIIYTIDVEAPVLALIDQARLSTDACRQLEEAGAADLAVWCVGQGDSAPERP